MPLPLAALASSAAALDPYEYEAFNDVQNAVVNISNEQQEEIEGSASSSQSDLTRARDQDLPDSNMEAGLSSPEPLLSTPLSESE